MDMAISIALEIANMKRKNAKASISLESIKFWLRIWIIDYWPLVVTQDIPECTRQIDVGMLLSEVWLHERLPVFVAQLLVKYSQIDISFEETEYEP